MTYTAHNFQTERTMTTDDINEAMAFVGAHVHATRGEDGRTAYPSYLTADEAAPRGSSCRTVIFWASLSGRTVRHDIATGNVKGEIAGTVARIR